MTTDITELAKRMKAAAEKATQGEWRRASTQFNGITATPFMLGRKEVIIAGASEKRDAEFIALANPANIIALVEAMEKAQQRIDELENDEVRQRLANAEHQLYMAELAKHNLKASRKAQFRKRRAAEKRIAELESRTVKLPSLKQTKSGERYVWFDGAFNYSQDVKASLTRSGIRWEAE